VGTRLARIFIVPNIGRGGRSLVEFVQRQRWFGGKARPIADAEVMDEGELAGIPSALAIVAVRFVDGGEERYFVPRVEDDRVCRALLGVLERGSTIALEHGRVRAHPIDPGVTDGGVSGPIRRSAPDQSNTSIVFGDELILKVFRRLEPGLNPDVEIGRFLTARGFTRVPALVADADYVADEGSGSSALMLQRFVPNDGNAWQMMLRTAERAACVALAETLGRRTGELHDVLSSDRDDPAFAPEPYTRTDLDALADGMRAFGARQLVLLREVASNGADFAGASRALADSALDRADALFARFDALRHVPDAGSRIRCHGDYHLGQTLVADGDVVILDFEGEPARSLAERRTKSSPLRDVAGMLRSFSYAAAASKRDASWERDVTTAFLDGYRAAAGHIHGLPAFGASFDTMLDAFSLDKAFYELGYELNNRPDWVHLPLTALSRLEWRQSVAWPSSQNEDPRIRSG